MSLTLETADARTPDTRVWATFPSLLSLWPLALLVAAGGAVGWLLGRSAGVPFDHATFGTLATVFRLLFPWFLLILLIWRACEMLVVERLAHPVRPLVAEIRGILTDVDRLAFGIAAFFLVAAMVGIFGHIKSLIVYLQPFSWDESFARWDRALHFGLDPWRLIWPVTGSPAVTSALNAAYHFWLFVVYFVVFVACFGRRGREASLTFFVALTLTLLVGGNLLATIFSSAGPVYYERIGLGPDFEPLMAELRAFDRISPVKALQVQEALWDAHRADGPLSGVSAMPSMHVATSVVMALYGFARARWAGWALTLFAAVIMVGSVQLGWHYAIDGYAGAIVAWLSWHAARRIVRVAS